MNKIKRIMLDPDGYVIIVFDTYEDRADFVMKCVQPGDVYANARIPQSLSTEGCSISWKLSQLPWVATIASGLGMIK